MPAISLCYQRQRVTAAKAALRLALDESLPAWDRNAALWALSETLELAPKLALKVLPLVDHPPGEISPIAAGIILRAGPPITADNKAYAKEQLLQSLEADPSGPRPYFARWLLERPGIREQLDQADLERCKNGYAKLSGR